MDPQQSSLPSLAPLAPEVAAAVYVPPVLCPAVERVRQELRKQVREMLAPRQERGPTGRARFRSQARVPASAFMTVELKAQLSL
jgi:hypothetical protein